MKPLLNEHGPLYIVDDYGMNYFVNSLNYVDVKIINTDKFILQNHMPKFDYIIQNPPYSRTTHLNFLNKGLDLLNDTGKMVIVEPATWLITLNELSNYVKGNKSNPTPYIKERLKGHVKKVIIENYNIAFHINNYVPCSITWVDNENTYDSFLFENCGLIKTVSSLDNCNLIGDIKLIKSIFDKIKNFDKAENHIYIPWKKDKSKKIDGNYYCKCQDILAGCNGSLCNITDAGRNTNVTVKNVNPIGYDLLFRQLKHGQFATAYIAPLYSMYKNDIKNEPLKKYDRGKHETENDDQCITGTKEELENWKYYVFNNSLPLFINICMSIERHAASLPYVPWLVDKKYTDEEIYKLFGFSKEEIELIENTIKRYERYSPWFKRYLIGDTSIEINQKYPWLEKDA